MSATPIFKLVDELPANNLTTKMLHAVDFFAGGQYRNLVGFENTIKVITGETDQALIQQIGERAINSTTTARKATSAPSGSTTPPSR